MDNINREWVPNNLTMIDIYARGRVYIRGDRNLNTLVFVEGLKLIDFT